MVFQSFLCEQLSFPWDRYPELAKEIDDYAKAIRLSVIGTGINPGFIMDTLVICFSTVLTTVNKIIVNRRVDVSKRRIPLQKKSVSVCPKKNLNP